MLSNKANKIENEVENERKKQSEQFLDYAGQHYDEYKHKWAKYFKEHNFNFDEDVFSETIVKVYDYLSNHQIADDTPSGLANYWFKAFRMNSLRETQYSRNLFKDENLTAEEVLRNEIDDDTAVADKVKHQTFDDWLMIYLLTIVERNYDALSFYCFRIYYIIPNMTYNRLKEITKVNDCKRRVVAIKKWLKEVVNLKNLEEEFKNYYDDD